MKTTTSLIKNIECSTVFENILKQIEFHDKQAKDNRLPYETIKMNAYLSTYLKENILNLKTK